MNKHRWLEELTYPKATHGAQDRLEIHTPKQSGSSDMTNLLHSGRNRFGSMLGTDNPRAFVQPKNMFDNKRKKMSFSTFNRMQYGARWDRTALTNGTKFIGTTLRPTDSFATSPASSVSSMSACRALLLWAGSVSCAHSQH